MHSSANTRRLRSRVATSTKYQGADHPKTLAARTDLVEAQLEDDIRRRLAAAPPLTDEQAERLARLLRGKS